MFRSVIRLMAFGVLSLFAIAPAALAGTRSRVEGSVFAPLQTPLRAGAKVRIAKLPLIDREETIVLEEFDVLAPNAVVEVFDGEGKPRRVKPLAMRQFRGSVDGDPGSIVYLSVVPGRKVSGIIIARDQKFSVWSSKGERAAAKTPTPIHALDVFIDELSSNDEAELFQGFTCGVEGKPVAEVAGALPKSLAANERNVKTNAALTGTQKTVLNLAVESDTALYNNFSGNLVNVEAFLRDLVAAMSTIYLRDLQTEIRIPYLGMHTTTDPFAVNPGVSGLWNGSTVTWNTFHALYEFGDRWHNTAPSAAARSAATLISGQSQMGGVGWIQFLCASDFSCGPTGASCNDPASANHWAGAYSYNGGVGLNVNDRTVPNPDALANFGAPSNGYWPLLQLAHEFGHNVQSPHTHCIQLSPADQATYGRTFVDNCFSGESGACFNGTPATPADGGGRGTIMSYCHFQFASGSVTRFTFGQPSEASHTIVDAMRSQLDALTPTGLSTITAPSSVNTGGSGAASVTNTAGLTFDWTITNGTFTGGGTTATGASVNFTGNVHPVTLKVVATNASGCSISDTKSVSVTEVTVNPPTGVLATATSATSVSVTWTNSGTATSYNVYRSSNGSLFTKISTDGAVTTTPFTDNTASANTAYLYKVRGANGGTESTDSNVDFAVAIAYTDGTLTAGSTSVKAAHFTELTTAANALRTLASLGAISFTQGNPAASGLTRASHVTDLRTGIDAARTALGFSAGTYSTDPTITVGSTLLKKAHVDQLRTAMQ